MSALGYHIIYFDLDTDDYNHLDNIQPSKDRVTAAIQTGRSNFLSIAHDIHDVTVNDLMPFMLGALSNAGYRCRLFPLPMSISYVTDFIAVVPLGECLGDPAVNWYRAP